MTQPFSVTPKPQQAPSSMVPTLINRIPCCLDRQLINPKLMSPLAPDGRVSCVIILWPAEKTNSTAQHFLEKSINLMHSIHITHPVISFQPGALSGNDNVHHETGLHYPVSQWPIISHYLQGWLGAHINQFVMCLPTTTPLHNCCSLLMNGLSFDQPQHCGQEDIQIQTQTHFTQLWLLATGVLTLSLPPSCTDMISPTDFASQPAAV